MSKTITIRVSDEDYQQLAAVAKAERRPISNFILHAAMNALADMFTVDDEEMKEILEDKELMQQLAAGDKDIKEGKYRIVR